jgi:curved DNA-binding protein CbpA
MANAIKKFPVPLIFKKIMKDNMSGELIVNGSNFKKELFFLKGNLIFATTTMENERLGDILLATGRITSTEFVKLSKIKQFSPRRVGEILVDITNLSRQDIYYALLYQVKRIALTTFALSAGEWTFVKKMPRIPGNLKFNIKMPEIIKEGVKEINDPSYYKDRFFLRAPVTTSIPETLGRFLSSDEIKFYLKLTKFANISVQQAIEKFEMPEKFFWQYLILFYLLSICGFVEYTVDTELNKNIEEINDLYEKIKDEDLDYYRLFGVKESAPISEIKESYFSFSKKYHPDRIQAPPDSTVKKKATEVFAEINRAFETLSKQEKKNEYDMKGHKPDNPPPTTSGDQVRRARELYLKANALYKKKQYFQAANMMLDAVKLDTGKPSYYLLLGLAQAKSPGTQKQAEKNLKKASEMEPWNADPVFALGELYRSENFLKKADQQFKKALELNMDHTLAGKAIKDLERLYAPKKPVFSIFGKKK